MMDSHTNLLMLYKKLEKVENHMNKSILTLEKFAPYYVALFFAIIYSLQNGNIFAAIAVPMACLCGEFVGSRAIHD